MTYGVDAATRTAIDRVEIGHLLSRYPFLVDRGRYEELSELFTEDGTFEGPVGQPGVGRVGIAEFFRRSAATPVSGTPPRFMRHQVTSQRVDLLDDGAARADSYFLALTESGLDHWGRYRDDIARGDGAWLIRRRQLTVDGFTSGSWWERNVAGAGR